MRKTIHILTSFLAATVAALLCTVSCECAQVDMPENQGSGTPISFVAEDVWPDLTKAPINGVSDLYGDGFMVWGGWTKCPDDNSYWVGEYSSGVYSSVFGTSGTKVSATDKNNDSNFDQTNDEWTYSPEKEWYKGYYNFAAALPASAFGTSGITGAHTSSTTFNGEEVTYTNNLTLNFPNNTYDLSSTQTDVMYAFATQDNSSEAAGTVKLSFEHICSKLSISLAAYDPTGNNRTLNVTRVTVYGLLNSIPTPLEFTQTATVGEETEVASENNLATKIADSDDRSTQTGPFKVVESTWSIASSTQESPVGVTLIEDLLVFPGTLSDTNPLKLRIDYTNVNGDPKSIFVKVTQGTWEPGKSYAYTFQADLSSLE